MFMAVRKKSKSDDQRNGGLRGADRQRQANKTSLSGQWAREQHSQETTCQ
jgi:hypothetical protein